MALKFYEASCIVVGTFNIYIIRPDWLGEVGLLPEGSEVKFESRLTHPGFRMSSPKLGATWIVQPNRLVLETNKPAEDCGASVDRILDCLPWTPLTALGCNVIYRGPSSAIEGWKSKTAFPPARAPTGYDLKQRSWHIGIERDDQVFNFQISDVEEHVELRANAHVALQNQDIDFARRKARQFFEFRRESVSLFQQIFNARFDDANNND